MGKFSINFQKHNYHYGGRQIETFEHIITSYCTPFDKLFSKNTPDIVKIFVSISYRGVPREQRSITEWYYQNPECCAHISLRNIIGKTEQLINESILYHCPQYLSSILFNKFHDNILPIRFSSMKTTEDTLKTKEILAEIYLDIPMFAFSQTETDDFNINWNMKHFLPNFNLQRFSIVPISMIHVVGTTLMDITKDLRL